MPDGLVRALFEILLYVIGVWHGTRLAKVLWSCSPRGHNDGHD